MKSHIVLALVLLLQSSEAFVAPRGFIAQSKTSSSSRMFIKLPWQKEEGEGSDVAVLDRPTNGEMQFNNQQNNKQQSLGEDELCVVPEEEELSESQKLMKKVKESGTAGIVSYALWELGFWALSVPVCLFGYKAATGHWPDLSDSDDLSKLGAEAFAFVNFARFAVPLRIGLALSTTPWIQENVIDKFKKEDEVECVPVANQDESHKEM